MGPSLVFDDRIVVIFAEWIKLDEHTNLDLFFFGLTDLCVYNFFMFKLF
jgi:hypothetical protein